MDADQEKSVPAKRILELIRNSIAASKNLTPALKAKYRPLPDITSSAAAGAPATTNCELCAGDKSAPVFISYQRAFVERVTQLKLAVEARGIPCWMATDDLVGNVQDAIANALKMAPAIIICYSHSYRESVYEI